MLRTGAVFLSIWAGLNLLLAVVCLAAITVFGQDAPGLRLMIDESEIRRLDPKWLAGINGLAALCNAFDAACCILVLVVTWTGLVRKVRWTFWGLLVALGFLQIFAFVSYSFFDAMNLRANAAALNLLGNVVSSALLLVGLGLSGYAILRRG